MKCPHCDQRNPSGAHQCLHCEASIHAGEAKVEPTTRMYVVLVLAALFTVGIVVTIASKDKKTDPVCTRQDAEIARYQADIWWERDTPTERKFRIEKRSKDVSEVKFGENFWTDQDIQKLRCYRKIDANADGSGPSRPKTSDSDHGAPPVVDPQRF